MPEDLATLVADGEAALERGEAAVAFEHLSAACARATAEDTMLPRLVAAVTAAARILGEQRAVLEWIARLGPAITDPVARAAFLRAEITMWSRLDTARALALEPEAVAAAEAVGDDEGVATVLALAAFVAYRRGDVRRCRDIAERARALEPISRAAHYQATRAATSSSARASTSSNAARS